MGAIDKFPAWLISVEQTEGEKLNRESRDFFRKAIECYSHFYDFFINCPNNIEIGVLNEYKPSELEKSYSDKATLIPFIIANVSENFHFEFVYQIRELAIGQREALESGSFYIAAILSRSIFETVCAHYYTFRRIEEKFNQCTEYAKEATKTKSSIEQQKLMVKINEVFYEIFSLVFNARSATSLDWVSYLKNFGFDAKSVEKTKRIHVNSAIEDIEKVSGLPLVKTYGLLSEFVHPNFGAKTLIVHTKKPFQKFMDLVTLGDNSDNPEAALWYIDQLSEALFYSFTLACSLHQRSSDFLNSIQRLSGIPDPKTLH